VNFPSILAKDLHRKVRLVILLTFVAAAGHDFTGAARDFPGKIGHVKFAWMDIPHPLPQIQGRAVAMLGKRMETGAHFPLTERR
jgi:hypothetical protein